MSDSDNEIRDTRIRAVQRRVRIEVLIGYFVADRNTSDVTRFACPFCVDTDYSLSIDPDLRLYKCSACHSQGDCLTFVMTYDGMSLDKALDELERKWLIE